ncbi:unnamed protein product [Bemisia tabaci]|nr:unnamed protein product [Bemisia tabaci]
MGFLVDNFLLLSLLLRISAIYGALPEHIELPPKEFLPSPVKYFSNEVNRDTNTVTDSSPNSEKQQEPRVGYINNSGYGSSASGLDYGSGYSGAPGLYSPVRLDIGVLVLGAIVGLGAIIIIPKILALFATGISAYASHAYGRGEPVDAAGIMDMMAKMDETLSNYNIDSSACMQKAVCSYFQPLSTPQGKADNGSPMLKMALNSGLVNFLIEGSKFKRAADEGKAGADCNLMYPGCPFSRQNIFASLKHLMATNAV